MFFSLPFQEQLRKRKEEEERIAAQNEFLNRSLRGSRKLQALESRPQGTVNDAFAADEETAAAAARSESPSTSDREVVHQAYSKWKLKSVNVQNKSNVNSISM